jgi:ubiquitin-protein ligase
MRVRVSTPAGALVLMAVAGMYKGGSFKFTFAINNNFPHEPPKVKCTQKIYHPNIDLDGNVCLNILREDWKPVLNLNAVIVGLQVWCPGKRRRGGGLGC